MSWKTLDNGILLKNSPITKTLYETYDEDIRELGYNRYELYDRDNFEMPIVIGYFKLISRELVAIHRGDNKQMTQKDIDDFLAELFEFMESDEEDLINEGIENRGISQAYIESVWGSKAQNDSLSNGEYVFQFTDGFLSGVSSGNGLSANARDFLNVERYIKEAEKWYNGDTNRIINEINLHAECLVNIPGDLLRSNVLKRQFSYPSGCCNYIAMAAHYRCYDVSFNDIVNSTHGDYSIVEKSPLSTKIKAYGEFFTDVTAQDVEVSASNDFGEELCGGTSGYVYVMINPSLPEFVKIGKTTRDPHERVKELSSATGVPTPFVLVYYKAFKDCHFAETVLHDYLEGKGVRVSGNREFFQISTVEAIDLINLYSKMEEERYS